MRRDHPARARDGASCGEAQDGADQSALSCGRALVWVACLCACAALLEACALFGKSAPLDIRYYSAERAPWSGPPAPVLAAALGPAGTTPQNAASGPAARATLRLGRVTSGDYLRERIAYRSSARELGYYETRRWTERPEAYLRRALASALFEERSLTRAVSGPAPTLEVELIEFDEQLAPVHAARVRARALLTDQRVSRFEHTFSAEQPVDGRNFERVASAMAAALDRCVEEISDRVVAELASAAPSANMPAVPSTDGFGRSPGQAAP